MFCLGGFCPGVFCPGGFCPGVYVRGVFVWGVFVLGARAVVQSTSTCREHLQLSKVLSVVESDICQTGSAIRGTTNRTEPYNARRDLFSQERVLTVQQSSDFSYISKIFQAVNVMPVFKNYLAGNLTNGIRFSQSRTWHH